MLTSPERLGHEVRSDCMSQMSEEELSSLFVKIKEDAGLMEKPKGVADLDAALAMAKEAGLDVSKADWLRNQANQITELSDESLDHVAGVYGQLREGWLAICRVNEWID